MATIDVLPPDLASQIAAGEVVERPASAAKELVENALDAGATRVDVAVDAGGIGRLSVSDDGRGMSPEDAPRCLERHATSKLRSLSDLERMQTYGFRGEALPSIASVSRFRLRTRSADADAGVELIVEGGGPGELRPVGASVGTQVEVRDLFFNVPARRKFLRATSTEAGHVVDVVESAALSVPEVTFTVQRDGRPVREWLRAGGREERVRQILDGEELSAVRGERGPLKLEAFLSRPERARSGTGGLKILVNARPVRDRAVAATIAQAYGSVLERGRYPRGIVYIDLPAELVDVNVHPQKSEVRFADPRALMDAIHGLVSRELNRAFSLPPATRRSEGAPPLAFRGSSSPGPAAPAPLADVVRPRSEPSVERAFARPLPVRPSLPDPTPPAEPAVTAAAEALIHVRDGGTAAPIRPSPGLTWSSLRFIAQVRHTYLICEGDEGLYLLDQHAAAERVTFSKLRRQYQSRTVAAQALLFPLTLEVTPAEAELVEQHAEQIAQVGLQLRARGSQALSVHAIPRLLQRASPERLVRDLLSELGRSGGREFSGAVDLALATMACHGSVRSGDVLSADAATALLRALDGADFAGHCPHGRPVVTFLSWSELERKVGRR